MKKILSGRQLERTVAVLLEKSDWTVEVQRACHGLLVDIWASDKHGENLIVECKAYRKLLGVATARQFVAAVSVLRQEQPTLEAWLVTISGFTPNALALLTRYNITGMTLEEVFARLGKNREELKIEDVDLRKEDSQAYSGSTRVFVIMPFSDDMLDVFILGIRSVTEKLDMVAKRADDIDHSGQIIEEIQSAIREYDIVIGDTSGANPNVCYEVGFAHGVGKQCILICKKGNKLPFDLQGMNHLIYKNILDLRPQLENKLKQVREHTDGGEKKP